MCRNEECNHVRFFSYPYLVKNGRTVNLILGIQRKKSSSKINKFMISLETGPLVVIFVLFCPHRETIHFDCVFLFHPQTSVDTERKGFEPHTSTSWLIHPRKVTGGEEGKVRETKWKAFEPHWSTAKEENENEGDVAKRCPKEGVWAALIVCLSDPPPITEKVTGGE